MSSKDIENLLREKLSAGSSRPLPSPGFEERVRHSLGPRTSGRWRRLSTAGLLATAAALAVVAVGLPWMLGPSRGAGAADGSSQPSDVASLLEGSAAPTTEVTAGSPEPTATPTGGLTSGRIWNFEFEYPTAWALSDNGTKLNGDQPLNPALGSLGHVAEDCPGIGTKNSKPCTTTWSLADGSVAMTFEWHLWDMDPRYYEPWDLLRAATTAPPTGTQLVTVAGVRTIFARNMSNQVPINPTLVSGDSAVPGADEVMTWQMVDRSNGSAGFQVTAAIRGPNTAELEAQVQATIASLHYATPIVPLPTDAASKKAALVRYFNDLAAGTSGLDTSCFPREPGATGSGLITTTFLAGRTLSKPLTVRCTSEIAIAPEQVWQLTLTYSWDAAPDHTAGTATSVEFFWPGWGSVGTDTGFDTMPYAIPMQGGGG